MAVIGWGHINKHEEKNLVIKQHPATKPPPVLIMSNYRNEMNRAQIQNIFTNYFLHPRATLFF